MHRRTSYAALHFLRIVVFLIPRRATCGASFSRYDIGTYIRAARESPTSSDTDSITTSLYRWKMEKGKDLSTKMLDNDDGCGLYFARSSIPDSGFGVFSGANVRRFERIANPEIGILLNDMTTHVGMKYTNSLLQSYPWSSWVIENGQFVANASSSAIPGCGMSSNAHLGLHNARVLDAGGRHHLGTMDRTKDCGAGAMSDFFNIYFTATSAIPEGSEIFLSYGEAWFTERESSIGIIPTKQDYDEADTIIHNFLQILKTVGQEWSAEDREERWQRVLGETTERARAALPESICDLQHASDVGSARHSVPNSQRSIEWLTLNGLCMDNIRIGPSTIPQAGRGAFATRIILKGKLIAPAPVIPIPRDLVIMHHQNLEEPIHDEVERQQLFLNYCFGHMNISSVLLFPYSSSVQAINHGGKDANAVIKWSTSDFNDVDLLEKKSLNDINSSGLVLEIVATRDVMLGEEVLIDYGREWQDAWERHVKEWEPKETRLSPHILNKDAASVVRTVGEPGYAGLQTACYYAPNRSDGNQSGGGKGIRWEMPEDGNHPKCLRPCDILSRRRNQGHDFYTARMHNFAHLETGHRVSESVDDIISDVPRWAIKYVEARYANDQFSKHAFRHEIGLPSGLIPPHWFHRSD